MSKDINRLKVVLAEKNEQTSGSQNNLEKILPPFPNGALIHCNPMWKLWWKSQSIYMLKYKNCFGQ